MQNKKIQTVEVPVYELISPEYNPRKHDDFAKEQLKESIRRFGIVDPVVANSTPDRKISSLAEILGGRSSKNWDMKQSQWFT